MAGTQPDNETGLRPARSSIALVHQTSMNQFDLAVVGKNGAVSRILSEGRGTSRMVPRPPAGLFKSKRPLENGRGLSIDILEIITIIISERQKAR